MSYNHLEIERKWQAYWREHETFKTDVYDFSKPKYYVLDMFPYPSGVGLHVGHPEGYTATDIMSRMKRMQGYNVLHPMGYDSFGLPAEQYAIKTNNHPAEFTERNIAAFTKQLVELGFDYDWSKLISTSDPKYYKWTQWIFKRLYLDGYAKYIEMPVNWCPGLGTVLSNDEIIDGKSERGGYPVEKKLMKQWVIDQAAFAEDLLAGLDKLDWPLSTKEMQRNWIGKSIGTEVTFKIDATPYSFSVFTTRSDTLFGATYCALAPENSLIAKITADANKEEVTRYIKESLKKSEIERQMGDKEKTGCFTGAYAINPVNNARIPIYVADYVLSSYGTGAIMAVPAHDERDYEFAVKHNLKIIPVLEGGDVAKAAYVGDGVHINSSFLNGLNKEDAIFAMNKYLEEKHLGKKKVAYKFREWIFARQRYWGEPVPVVHMDQGGIYPLPDAELPLVLPKLKAYKAPSGMVPLDSATDWVRYDKDGIKGRRETSTMPGSAGSSWYFMRYLDPRNEQIFADKKLLDHWLPVDLYIGGPEHAVGHLIYSRIWTKYLHQKGYLAADEPFKKLVHQGMMLGNNGIKMGKRYPKYVVDTSEVVLNYGADALRLYEMFMGPLEASKPWSDQGVEGAYRFLARVYRMIKENNVLTLNPVPELEKIYHQTVKKVTSDFENLAFNTAISQLMIFVNEVYRINKLSYEYAEGFVKMLSCIAPHLGEELWESLGHKGTIAYEKWPSYQEDLTRDDLITVVVQVNGKLRARLSARCTVSDDELKSLALKEANKYIAGKEILKIIIVKKKIVSIVVK